MIDRYKPVIVWYKGYDYTPCSDMEESQDGEYVKYEDILKIIHNIIGN